VSNAKAIVASYAGVLVFAGVVFLAAGTFAYWQGLLYLVLALIGTTISHLLMPPGSTLTGDRARDAAEGQPWDKRLLGAFFLVNLGTFVVAGLDSGRFGWTRAVPIRITILGAAIMLLGQVLFAVAKRQNAFFSSTVRIQSERGHQVCDTGVYRLVRHPGYLGMLLSLLAFPLVMNSYWAFVPAGIGAVLLLVRTALEDRFLRHELAGYDAYAQRTRWKLLPTVF
jgi:protein-S-isoprenylcysteine O-methyltransferase Ste14